MPDVLKGFYPEEVFKVAVEIGYPHEPCRDSLVENNELVKKSPFFYVTLHYKP